MSNPRSAYVRRKNSKKGCSFCKGTDVLVYSIGGGSVHIRCRSCHASTIPGMRVWQTWDQIYAFVFGS